MKAMTRQYFSWISSGVWVFVVAVCLIFSDRSYVPEILVTLTYGSAIVYIVRLLLQKSNDQRIILRTKNYNWIRAAFFIALGTFAIFRNSTDGHLIFGLMNASTSQGIGFILFGIASFEHHVVIDREGVRVNDWFVSFIKYDNISEVEISSTNFFIRDDSLSFNFKLFVLNETDVSRIQAKIEQWKRSMNRKF